MAGKQPTKAVEKPTTATEDRADLLAKLYMTNPYTNTRFEPNQITADVKLDSWTKAQIAAGLLEICK